MNNILVNSHVFIFKIDNGKIYFKIKCTVSKGTYIRSLVRDIGYKLGCYAVMNSLIRTRQGNFSIDNSFSLEDIKNNNFKFISIIDVFPLIPRIVVDNDMLFKIKNGVIMDKFFDGEMAFILDSENNLISLYKNENNRSRAFKMFI